MSRENKIVYECPECQRTCTARRECIDGRVASFLDIERHPRRTETQVVCTKCLVVATRTVRMMHAKPDLPRIPRRASLPGQRELF